MRKYFIRIGCCIFLLLGALLTGVANAQQPVPTPPDETIRIPTEEVHLTIRAEGPFPGVAPKLRADELMVFENGVPQTVTSVRAIPAQVLVLVDTGAALSFAKTREIATLATQLVIDDLPEGSAFSIMQYSDLIETPVGWTTDRRSAITALSTGLPTGRRSLLSDALGNALKTLVTRPAENRHLVLVTDGLDGPRAMTLESPALRALEEANIVIHVIGYTAMEEDGAKEAMRRVRLNTRPSKPRIPKEIFDDMVRSLPISIEQKEFLRMQNEAQQIIIIDLDSERRKMLRARREEWAQGETTMAAIAIRSGGSIRVPVDATALLNDAIAIGRSIGEYFDVTYSPEHVTGTAAARKDRTISVTSRSDALKLHTRKFLRSPESK